MNVHRIFLPVILLSGLQAGAQFFETALEAHTASAPPKIFMHHDQQQYVPGETIWFKAYVIHDGRPVPGNSNLYVRLVSPTGTEIVSKVYPLAGAVAHGEIELADSLLNGIYHLQAMTTTMLASGVYQVSLIPVTKSNRMKIGSAEPAIRFHPEGGQLISGIPNRVSFLAELNGMPVAINGQVREKGSSAGVTFKTYRAGLGEFEFTPVAGNVYEAEVEWKDGKKVYPLPPVSSSGIQL